MLWRFIFFFMWFFAAEGALAADYHRKVEFEWDMIEGAKSYDLEIQKGDSSAPKKFVTAEPMWKGSLAPGKYTMKIRAKDRRGVPGDWSAPADLNVNLETVKALAPRENERTQTLKSKETEVSFEWEKVPGAEKYSFQIQSSDGVFQKEELLSNNKLNLFLPVANQYKWTVKALGMGMESDEATSRSFTLIGAPVPAPKIEMPETLFVRELRWSASDWASHYELALELYNPQKKKWEKVQNLAPQADTRLPFDPAWPGGKYRLQITATASLRAPSSKSQIVFSVKPGDRSPAAEETATLRLSIERLTGWYAIASYLITITDYQGTNFDKTNTSLHYSAIGGTGRLGAGYLSKTSPWGFVGVADLSGITVEGGDTFTFASVESNAIHRTTLGERGELRQQVGLFYKELPETLGSAAGAITENNLLRAAGPHYGIEYWLALTSKLGFQVHAHLYPSLLTVKTPTGEPIRPTLSAQAGLLGSYRLGPNITGLMGYAYRQDQIEYRARPGLGSASSADYNSVLITGHYLNLFLEWAL